LLSGAGGEDATGPVAPALHLHEVCAQPQLHPISTFPAEFTRAAQQDNRFTCTFLYRIVPNDREIGIIDPLRESSRKWARIFPAARKCSRKSIFLVVILLGEPSVRVVLLCVFCSSKTAMAVVRGGEMRMVAPANALGAPAPSPPALRSSASSRTSCLPGTPLIP
jgi:hypothetical protein